jgi:hypothetical protein
MLSISLPPHSTQLTFVLYASKWLVGCVALPPINHFGIPTYNLGMYYLKPLFLRHVSILCTISCMLIAHTIIWPKNYINFVVATIINLVVNDN